MKKTSVPKASDKTSCRRKDLMGKQLSKKDGVYTLNKGKPTEHSISIRSGFVDGGDSPAIFFPRDGHTEYWRGGFPEDRSDGSPAIVTNFGLLTESWKNKKWILRTEYNIEMEMV